MNIEGSLFNGYDITLEPTTPLLIMKDQVKSQ